MEKIYTEDTQASSNSLVNFLAYYMSFRKEYTTWLSNQPNDYNLITAMLKPNDEVRLHSRVIFSWLNPSGLHRQGSDLAAQFMASLGDEWAFWLKMSRLKASREKDRIDLKLHDGQRFVIIENKLNGPDQKSQVRRYIEDVQKNHGAKPGDILLVFLAKGRRNPSEKSLGGWKIESAGGGRLYIVDEEKKVRAWYLQCSYGTEVLDWIARCETLLSHREDDGQLNNLRFAFREYRGVVEKISGIAKENKKMALDAWIHEDDDPERVHERIVCAESIIREMGKAKAEWLHHAMTNGLKGLLESWIHLIEPVHPKDLGIHCFDQFEKRHAISFFTETKCRAYNKGRFWKVVSGQHTDQLALVMCIGERWLHVGLLPLRDGRISDGTWTSPLDTETLNIKCNPISKTTLPGLRSYGVDLQKTILQMTPFKSSEQARVVTSIMTMLFGEVTATRTVPSLDVVGS